MKDYKRHIAFDNLMKDAEYGIREGFVFGSCNVQKEGNRTYFPIYMVSFIES